MRKLLVALLFAGSFQQAAGSGTPDLVPRKTMSLAGFSGAIEDLASRASAAVVQISVRARRRVDEDSPRPAGYVSESHTTGSGVIVASDGYIVTNAHVVENARTIEVSLADRSRETDSSQQKHFRATLIGLDQLTDLALLKIDGKDFPP